MCVKMEQEEAGVCQNGAGGGGCVSEWSGRWVCARMEQEEVGGCQNGAGGGCGSGWSGRRRVGIRMEREVGVCQDGVGGGGYVSRQVGVTPRVDQYMAACDIGCRTASVEFGSAASLLDRNELILSSCRDSLFGSLESDQVLTNRESPDLSKIH